MKYGDVVRWIGHPNTVWMVVKARRFVPSGWANIDVINLAGYGSKPVGFIYHFQSQHLEVIDDARA